MTNHEKIDDSIQLREVPIETPTIIMRNPKLITIIFKVLKTRENQVNIKA